MKSVGEIENGNYRDGDNCNDGATVDRKVLESVMHQHQQSQESASHAIDYFFDFSSNNAYFAVRYCSARVRKGRRMDIRGVPRVLGSESGYSSDHGS